MYKKGSPVQNKAPPQNKYSYLNQRHQRHSSLSFVHPQSNGVSDSMNQTLDYSRESEQSPARRYMMDYEQRSSNKSGKAKKKNVENSASKSEIVRRLVNRQNSDGSIRKEVERAQDEEDVKNYVDGALDIPNQLIRIQNNLNHIHSNQTIHSIQPAENVPVIKYSSFVEVVSQLREIIHKLQRQDAVHRQELKKLKTQNSSLKENITDLETKVQELEKARQIDLQYLIKLDNHLLNEKRYNKKPSISRVQDFDPSIQEDSSQSKRNIIYTTPKKGLVQENQRNRQSREGSPNMPPNNGYYMPPLSNQKHERKSSYIARSDMHVFSENDNPHDPQGGVHLNWPQVSSIQSQGSDLKFEEKEDSVTYLKTVTMSDIDISEENPYYGDQHVHSDQSPTIEIARLLNQQRGSQEHNGPVINKQPVVVQQQQQQQQQPQQKIPQRTVDISNIPPPFESKAKNPKNVFTKLSDLGSGSASISSIDHNPSLKESIIIHETKSVSEQDQFVGNSSPKEKAEAIKDRFKNVSPAVLEIMEEYNRYLADSSSKKTQNQSNFESSNNSTPYDSSQYQYYSSKQAKSATLQNPQMNFPHQASSNSSTLPNFRQTNQLYHHILNDNNNNHKNTRSQTPNFDQDKHPSSSSANSFYGVQKAQAHNNEEKLPTYIAGKVQNSYSRK